MGREPKTSVWRTSPSSRVTRPRPSAPAAAVTVCRCELRGRAAAIEAVARVVSRTSCRFPVESGDNGLAQAKSARDVQRSVRRVITCLPAGLRPFLAVARRTEAGSASAAPARSARAGCRRPGEDRARRDGGRDRPRRPPPRSGSGLLRCCLHSPQSCERRANFRSRCRGVIERSTQIVAPFGDLPQAAQSARLQKPPPRRGDRRHRLAAAMRQPSLRL